MFMVFLRKALNSRRGKVGGGMRDPHPMAARLGGTRAATRCGCLVALLCLPFGLRVHVGKIGTLAFVLSNSKNISSTTFLK